MCGGTLFYWHTLARIKRKESEARIAAMEGGRRKEDKDGSD
jgi:hypothetical protein